MPRLFFRAEKINILQKNSQTSLIIFFKESDLSHMERLSVDAECLAWIFEVSNIKRFGEILFSYGVMFDKILLGPSEDKNFNS